MGRNCGHALRLRWAGLDMEVVIANRSRHIQNLSGLCTAIPDIVLVEDGLYEGGGSTAF